MESRNIKTENTEFGKKLKIEIMNENPLSLYYKILK